MPAPSDGSETERRSKSPRSDLRAHVVARRAEIERQLEVGKAHYDQARAQLENAKTQLDSVAKAQLDQAKIQLDQAKAQFDQAQEKIRERTGRDLIVAILIGLAIGVFLLLSLLVVKQLFMVFAGTLIAFASYELATALGRANYEVPRVPTVIVAVATIPVAYYLGEAGQLLALLVGVVFIVGWRSFALLRTGTKRFGMLKDIAAIIFVQTYVVFLASFSVVLTAADGGRWWTLAFIIVVVSADTGAYAFGLMLGKHQMAPTISPKKTWEGFAGATITCIIAGILLAIFMLDQPWWFGILFGSVILITATVGDLVESLIKRDLGIKDMSSWIPGHGGFLDRLDSLLPSAAVAMLLFRLFAR